jgi:dTDP-4-dehydrorhamnose reductase
MLRLGREQESVRVVADQFGCPTNAADLADAILSVIAKFKEGNDIQWGTYHFCGDGATSWHGFAEAIFSIAKVFSSFQVKKIKPITSAEFPTPAKRPSNSVLSCASIERNFGIRPKPWKESLAAMLEQLFTQS